MSYSSWTSHGPGRSYLQKDLTKESSRKDWLTQVWAELRGQSRMLRSLGFNLSGKAEEIRGKKKRIRIWERWSHRGEATIARGTALQQGKWGRNTLAFSPLTSWSLAGASHWLPLTGRQTAKMQTTGISCLKAQEGEGKKMGPWRQMEMTAASKPGSSGGYCGFCPNHGDNINIAIKQVAWIFWFHRVNKVVFQL